MTNHLFDTVARRTAITRDRRAALGILLGAVLAPIPQLVGANVESGKPKNECDDKDERQKAQKRVKGCERRAETVCFTHLDVFTAAACAVDMEACCRFLAKCDASGAKKCVKAVLASYGIS